MIDGKRVVAAREAQGWTQVQLAWECQRIVEQLRLSERQGVSLSTIARVETMKQDITVAKLRTLARALKLEPGEILLPLEATA